MSLGTPEAHHVAGSADHHFAPAAYDYDAASPRSTADQASDSEDEVLVEGSQGMLEAEDYKASVLRDEEEQETLLTKKGPFGGVKRVFRGSANDVGSSLRDRISRKQLRMERRGSGRGSRGENAEEGQVLFELEEGFKDTSSRSSSSNSLRLDRDKWNRYEKQVAQYLELPPN